MAQVGMDDDAQLLEVFEVPVDGGEVDIGGPGLHLAGQLLGRLVPLGAEDGLQEEAPGRGGAPPSFSHQRQHGVHGARRGPVP